MVKVLMRLERSWEYRYRSRVYSFTEGKEILVPQEQMDLMVQKVTKEIKVTREILVLPVLLEQMEQMDLMVQKVTKEIKVTEVGGSRWSRWI